MKKVIILLAAFIIVFNGCYGPVESIQSFVVNTSNEIVPSSPNSTSSAREPSNNLSDLFQGENCEIDRFSKVVLQADGYVYYIINDKILRYDIKNQIDTEIIRATGRIQNVFFDKSGILYYYSWTGDDNVGSIHKYLNGKDILVINMVDNITSIDDECIYYNGVNKYYFETGQIERQDFLGDPLNGIMMVIRTKPLTLIEQNEMAGFYNMRTNRAYYIEDYIDYTGFTSEDSKCFLCKTDSEKNEYRVFDFDINKEYGLVLPEYGSLFSFSNYLSLISLESNLIYLIDKSTNKTVYKTTIFDKYQSNDYLHYFFTKDSYLYVLLFQVIERNEDELPTTVRPMLITINVPKKTANIEYYNEQISIGEGDLVVECTDSFYWIFQYIYTNGGEYEYITRFSMDN